MYGSLSRLKYCVSSVYTAWRRNPDGTNSSGRLSPSRHLINSAIEFSKAEANTTLRTNSRFFKATTRIRLFYLQGKGSAGRLIPGLRKSRSPRFPSSDPPKRPSMSFSSCLESLQMFKRLILSRRPQLVYASSLFGDLSSACSSSISLYFST